VAMALHCDPAVVSWVNGEAGEVMVPGCKPVWLAFLPGRAEQSLGCGKTDRGPEGVWTVVVGVSAKLGTCKCFIFYGERKAPYTGVCVFVCVCVCVCVCVSLSGGVCVCVCLSLSLSV